MTLEAWYPLHDEQANDYSGNGNDGTLNGGPTTGVAGRGGLEAMSFDGTDDYISTPLTADDLNFPLTISTWFYTPESPNWASDREILVSGWAMNLRLASGRDDIEARTFQTEGGTSNSVFSNTSLSGRTWYHVAFVFESGTVKIYLNGSNDGIGTAYDSSENNAVTISRGASAFYGNLTDFRVYSRALSDSEIQTLYEWGSLDLARPPTDGVSRYALDGDATDSWGSNDGTTSGGLVYSPDAIRGQSGDFDASDDYISLPSLGSLQTYTVSAWMKHGGYESSYERLISFDSSTDGNGILFQQDENNSRFRFGHKETTSGSHVWTYDSPPVGEWVHYTLTYNGSTIVLYRNGVLTDSASASDHQYSNDIGNYIGRGGDAAEFYDGLIDDVRIYDYALEPHEVHELYRFGTRGRDWREMLVTA